MSSINILFLFMYEQSHSEDLERQRLEILP